MYDLKTVFKLISTRGPWKVILVQSADAVPEFYFLNKVPSKFLV